MITGLAHTALCVADVDAAVAWYRDVLGLTVLSPPYRMDGPDIERDMGELVPSPVVVKAAIIGVPDDSDRVHRGHRVSERVRSRPTGRRVGRRSRLHARRAARATTSPRRAPTSKRRACASSWKASPTSPGCAPRGSPIRGTTCSSSSRRSAAPTGRTTGSSELELLRSDRSTAAARVAHGGLDLEVRLGLEVELPGDDQRRERLHERVVGADVGVVDPP